MGTIKGISLLDLVRRHWRVLLVGYVFAFVDPFGINSKTSQALSDAFDRMYSPVYTRELANFPSADLVDVILIDDFSIRSLSNPEIGYLQANDWPLSYNDYGVIINALKRLGYGTIILDITFYRERRLGGETNKSFQNLIRRLDYLRDEVGTRVILGAGVNPEPELEESILPLIDSVTAAGLTGWSGYGEYYPVFLELGDRKTLAKAGFDAYCRHPDCDDLAEAKAAPLVPSGTGMHISWGQPAQRVAASLRCDTGHEPSANSVKVFGLVVWDAIRNLFGSETIGSGGQQPCPPIPTAMLSDVFCPKGKCDDFFPTGGSQSERIAMVGVSLPSARDLFDPPIPGRLPGVYLHAEALRNLLFYGPDYLKPIGLKLNLGFNGKPPWTLPIDLILAWPLLLWVVLVVVRMLLHWRWGWEYTSGWPELTMELIETTVVLVLLGLIYIAVLQCNRTPGFLTDLMAFMPWLWVAIRNERKEMENEYKTRALAACTPEQLGSGRDAGY
ncbi:CHASE2 domain-containing protein [Marinobacter salexigens]|uniref:CHASE2 domain-containing protein n=1 Tax=Marinobacter salexigens TaxID=1925763 RepID=UPI00137481B4|nr:CHASE2 domain-containing protein [Marinobacter salexigens]